MSCSRLFDFICQIKNAERDQNTGSFHISCLHFCANCTKNFNQYAMTEHLDYSSYILLCFLHLLILHFLGRPPFYKDWLAKLLCVNSSFVLYLSVNPLKFWCLLIATLLIRPLKVSCLLINNSFVVRSYTVGSSNFFL